MAQQSTTTVMIALMVLLGLGISLPVLMFFAGKRRIRQAISRRGGTLRRIDWMPLGLAARGLSPWRFSCQFSLWWWSVSYIDASGNWHIVRCAATLLSIMWADDRVVGSAPRGDEDVLDRMSS